MHRWNLYQRVWVPFYNQSNLAYVGLEREPDIESDEDITAQKPSRSTLLIRAFSERLVFRRICIADYAHWQFLSVWM
jgi:hypothetical protein